MAPWWKVTSLRGTAVGSTCSEPPVSLVSYQFQTQLTQRWSCPENPRLWGIQIENPCSDKKAPFGRRENRGSERKSDCPTVTPWNTGVWEPELRPLPSQSNTLCHYITSTYQILHDFLGHPWMKLNTMSKGGALFQAHLAFSISWSWLEFWLECWNHFYFQALVI